MTQPEERPAETGGHDAAAVEAATAWFVRLSSDQVTDQDRRAFQTWCASDPAHRDAYAQVEALWNELGGLPDRRRKGVPRSGAPASVAAAAPGRPHRRPRSRTYAALAACLLVAVLYGLWAPGGYDRLRADHATAVGETSRITLADGSVLELNTDTALAVDLSGDRRRIRLFRGEAYFAVAADSNRPFEVSAAGGVARAVGTAFVVRREREAMAVVVAEGRVAVSRGREGRPVGEGVLLGPGDSLRYGTDGQAVRNRVDVRAATAWRQGKLVFADLPLRAVVAELDRYRPGSIFLLNSNIADERFSGVVDLSDTDRALAAIESTLPVDVVHVTGYLTLLRGRD